MEIKDILGIQPISESVKIIVEKSTEGISEFLSLTCKPALEEYGLLLRDHIRTWRLNNVNKVLEKAKSKYTFDGNQLQLQANPRVGISIFENISLIDDEQLQDFWAGLFVSSCSENGQNDENLIYIDLLKKMTSLQAKIFKYACENIKLIEHPNKLVTAKEFQIDFNKLVELTGTDNIYRLDMEIDHLREIGLLDFGSGFVLGDTKEISLTPSVIGLNLFIKCQGFNISPVEFWRNNIIES
jgi:hypothetical protein